MRGPQVELGGSGTRCSILAFAKLFVRFVEIRDKDIDRYLVHFSDSNV